MNTPAVQHHATAKRPPRRPSHKEESLVLKPYPHLHLVVIECSGVVSDRDWREFFPRLWADPAFDRSCDKIVDTRQVTRFGVKSDTIFRHGELARQVYAGQPASKTAIVAPLAEIHGVARQYQQVTDGIPVHTGVFWTYEDACAWLGKNPELPAQ